MNESYRKVGLWSAEQARSDYLNTVQVSNPQSPLVLYPRTSVVETRVKSVSPVGRNVALVRFDTIRRDAGGQVQLPRPWVAVIRYRFSGEPMKLEDRFLNPLGFQVVRYRRDAETVVPEAAIAPAPATILVPGASPPPVTVVAPGQATTTTVTTATSPLGAVTAAARSAAERRRAKPEPQL
jgi:type IV secretion system protein VirB8